MGMGQFQPVNGNDLRLAPNIDLNVMGPLSITSMGTFVGMLQRCTVVVVMNEYKLGTLEDSWNRYRCYAMLRDRNRGQCAYLVPQALKLKTGGIVGDEIPRECERGTITQL